MEKRGDFNRKESSLLFEAPHYLEKGRRKERKGLLLCFLPCSFYYYDKILSVQGWRNLHPCQSPETLWATNETGGIEMKNVSILVSLAAGLPLGGFCCVKIPPSWHTLLCYRYPSLLIWACPFTWWLANSCFSLNSKWNYYLVPYGKPFSPN